MTLPEHVGEDVLTSNEADGKVIRGSAMRIGANVVGLVLGLLTATLLLRHLGVEESGRYVTVLSLVGIAVSIVDTGLNVSASSDLAVRAPADRRGLQANIVAQRMVVALLALIGLSLSHWSRATPARWSPERRSRVEVSSLPPSATRSWCR